MTSISTTPLRSLRDIAPSFIKWRGLIGIVLGVLVVHVSFYVAVDLSRHWQKQTRPDLSIEFSAAPSEAAQAGMQSTPTPTKKRAASATPKAKPETKDTSERTQKKSTQTPSDGAQEGQTNAVSGGVNQSARAGTAPTMNDDKAPTLLSNPKPQYPIEAYAKQQQGKVVLAIEVLETGQVGRMKLLMSSGVESIDESAMNAVRAWLFSPAQSGGKVVRQWIKLPIEFNLKK